MTTMGSGGKPMWKKPAEVKHKGAKMNTNYAASVGQPYPSGTPAAPAGYGNQNAAGTVNPYPAGTPQAASDAITDPTTGNINPNLASGHVQTDAAQTAAQVGTTRNHRTWSNHKNADSYRINGRFQNGKLHLVGPAADFLEVGAALTAIGNTTPDGNGNVNIQFDGEGNLPIKQAGN